MFPARAVRRRATATIPTPGPSPGHTARASREIPRHVRANVAA
jgi:hypothetical protein